MGVYLTAIQGRLTISNLSHNATNLRKLTYRTST
jgi:hypothetical protein